MEDGVSLSPQAHEELDLLFATTLDMMLNTRDSLLQVDKLVVEKILFQGRALDKMLLDFRLTHWQRVETGVCDYHASSLYLDILDSIGAIKQYMEKIARSLLELEKNRGSD